MADRELITFTLQKTFPFCIIQPLKNEVFIFLIHWGDYNERFSEKYYYKINSVKLYLHDVCPFILQEFIRHLDD